MSGCPPLTEFGLVAYWYKLQRHSFIEKSSGVTRDSQMDDIKVGSEDLSASASSVVFAFCTMQAKPKLSRKSSGGPRRSSSSETDPERLFSKQQKIGKGNFGEVYKG